MDNNSINNRVRLGQFNIYIIYKNLDIIIIKSQNFRSKKNNLKDIL